MINSVGTLQHSGVEFLTFFGGEIIEPDDSVRNLSEFVSNFHCGEFLVHLPQSRAPPKPIYIK